MPVLGSQPAGDVSHKPSGRLPLLFARPAVTLPLADLGFLEGGDFGNPRERSERALGGGSGHTGE